MKYLIWRDCSNIRF